MIVKILGGIVAAIALVLTIASLQPDDFVLSRTISIARAPDAVFGHINDFHAWTTWSPWAKIDPIMQTIYEGPTSGVGATYKWSGNADVGQGSMEIISSNPGRSVKIQLNFIEPISAANITEFVLDGSEAGTNVTWTMTGKNNLVSKIFYLFTTIDKMVGPDFEKGLAQLKSTVEASP